jgi:TIR domain
VLEGARPGSLQGPIINISTAVEGALKMVLEKIIRFTYGRDLGRAQSELKLRSRRFGEFALGNIVVALRNIKNHPDFEFISELLDSELLEEIEQFTNARNRWAHAGRRFNKSSHAEIYEAHHIFSSGIIIVRYAFKQIIPTLSRQEEPAGDEIIPSITLPKDSRSRQFGIFLSHSAADAKVVSRIAMGLRALNYPVWYADWAIQAGQSIVERIGEALAQNDTLLVLLSQASVSSAWVRHEFTVALMDQLSGQDVTVIPILIEECPIPSVLRNLKYIDMRPERFEQGFIKLIETLGARQA